MIQKDYSAKLQLFCIYRFITLFLQDYNHYVW